MPILGPETGYEIDPADKTRPPPPGGSFWW